MEKSIIEHSVITVRDQLRKEPRFGLKQGIKNKLNVIVADIQANILNNLMFTI
jgi:sensor domain CHASE-containing protein